MKKLTSLLLAAAMVMALAACGNSGGDKSGTGAPPPSGPESGLHAQLRLPLGRALR